MAAIAVSAASVPAPYAVMSSVSAMTAAGKRRRELPHVGSVGADATPKMAKIESGAGLLVPLVAAQPIVTVRKSDGAKRPQMKYDPSVPMTKQQTSEWRRDQRRKRNRESAAACRKRQRDRISELEVEVSGWKAKFDDALMKLKGMDGDSAAELESQLETLFSLAPKQPTRSRCSTPPNDVSPDMMTSITIPVHQGGTDALMQAQQSHIVSPHDRPKFIPPLVISGSAEDLHFPILEDPLIKNITSGVVPQDSIINPRVENTRQYLKEITITRPAKSRLLYTLRLGRWMDQSPGLHYLTQ